MKSFNVENRKLKIEEYQALRESTGWNPVEDNLVETALEKDLFSICVYDEERIVGIGRIIGDGALYFYIQDIIVLPEYKGLGIGKLIMDNIEIYLGKEANNNSFIGLMAADGVRGFYTKYGYEERPKDKPGMYKIMKKPNSNIE